MSKIIECSSSTSFIYPPWSIALTSLSLTFDQEGQDSLQSVATDTLQIMADGQKEVLDKQEVLKESQVNLTTRQI